MAKWQPLKLSGFLSEYIFLFFQFTAPKIFLDLPLKSTVTGLLLMPSNTVLTQ